MQWGFWRNFCGPGLKIAASLRSMVNKRWYLNYRCWLLVPFVQSLWTRTSPLTHASSFCVHVHVHIAPLTQLWVCQGKWGRQGFLMDQVFHLVFPLFFYNARDKLAAAQLLVCMYQCVACSSDPVRVEQLGEHSQGLCKDIIQCRTCCC